MELPQKKSCFYNCTVCHYNTQLKYNLDKHFLTNKHLEKMSKCEKSQENSHEKYETYNCEKCQYITNDKRDYKKHVLTIKHLTKINSQNSHTKYEKPEVIHNCEKCDYSTKKKEDYKKHLDTKKHKSKFTNTPGIESDGSIASLLIEIIKDNKELRSSIVELTKNQQLITNNTSIITTNNNNNNNNNQFNLNFFLNETCKDAMNINEFINSLNVTIEDFENTGKLGYIEGITQIILNGLKGVDTTKRPIHCTDVKRETVYIKSDDSWEKENQEKEKLKKVVKQVARMNLSQLPRWQRENPASEVLDTREHCQYMKYSLAALGGVGDKAEEQNIDKIMRNVMKEITIDKK